MFAGMRAPRTGPGSRPVLAAVLLALLLAGCNSLTIERQSLTSGTFRSRAWAVTILSWDLPKGALDIARENASDTRLINMEIEEVKVTPYLGWWDWLLDIVGLRVATVSGTWGFSGQEG